MGKWQYTSLFGAILVLDQISKWYVFEMLLRVRGQKQSFIEWMTSFQSMADTLASLADFTRMEITSFFNLVVVWNTGVSFGMLQNAPDFMPTALTWFAVIVGIIVFIWGIKTTQTLERYAALLISAGAIGNALDRFRFHAVADFVDLHVAGYHWPAFNVADASIVLGAGLLIVYILFIPQPTGAGK